LDKSLPASVVLGRIRGHFWSCEGGVEWVEMSHVRISGRAVVSVLKENPRHGKTTIDPG
jgi:hypothetical protein